MFQSSAMNSAPVKKEAEEDTMRWNDSPLSWVDKVNIVEKITIESNIQIQYRPV